MQFSDSDINAILSATGTSALLNGQSCRIEYRLNSLDQMGVLTDRPQATFKASDLTGLDLKTATLFVAGETFRLTKPQPDGSGFTSVLLTRVQ